MVFVPFIRVPTPWDNCVSSLAKECNQRYFVLGSLMRCETDIAFPVTG